MVISSVEFFTDEQIAKLVPVAVGKLFVDALLRGSILTTEGITPVMDFP
jgi:hypothetical protein